MAPAYADGTSDRESEEAALTGNSSFDARANWIDYAAAGCRGPEDLLDRIVHVLRATDLARDVFEIGLRRTLDPAQRPELARRFVGARRLLRERMQARHLTHASESFDRAAYIENASVAENILFGTPVGDYFALDRLDRNDYLLGVIESAGLTEEFIGKGLRLAAIMADIFHDLPPGHEFFERFSFILAEDLPSFDSMCRRAESDGVASLEAVERGRLIALTFKLVAAQHHVGLIDADFRKGVLAARAAFARALPDRLRGSVQFFDAGEYNAAASISDNVLFGKLALDRPAEAGQLNALMAEVITELGLAPTVIDLGLDYPLGTGAARLSAQQRQKLAIARCLLKRPDLLILNDALAGLEPAAQQTVFAQVRAEMRGRSLLLLEPGSMRAAEFERVFSLEQGRIVERSRHGGTAAREISEEGKPRHQGEVDIYELVAILTRIPLFSGIDRSRLKLLAFTSELAAFEAGETVFRQGDAGDRAYVIIEGVAEVILESEGGGGAKVVAELRHNQLFGEMALLSNLPRTTSIRARTKLSLLALSHDVFLRLTEENPAIATSMARTLAERLAATLRDYSRKAAATAVPVPADVKAE